jgi:hypothetical protein
MDPILHDRGESIRNPERMFEPGTQQPRNRRWMDISHQFGEETAMRSQSAAEAAATAQAALRHYARLTNLVLASTVVGLFGSGRVITELDRMLRAVGAQVRTIAAPVPADVDLLILASIQSTPLSPADILPGGSPLIILDVGGASIDQHGFDQLPSIPARAGITGRRTVRETFLLDPLLVSGA